MIDNGYLFAKDEKRLFINTSLGCKSKCQFCYLTKMGIKGMKKKTSDEVLELLKKSDYKWNEDTLITMGCFSECFDEENKDETIKIAKYFLERGNQVQIATKRYVSYDYIEKLLPLIKYYGQFILFVSTSTISQYDNYEKGTEKLEKRFKNFDLIKNNIPVVLYIKPVIENVTIKDVDLYKKLIEEKKISDVVIGSIFTEEENIESVHFSNDSKLFYNECKDEEEIIKSLSKVARVFRRSSEVLKYYKARKELIEKVKVEVYNLLKKDESGHGMEHVNRVYDLSLKFARKEEVDEFIPSLIALLHEVDDYKLFGEENASNLTNAKSIMSKVNIDDNIQEKVLDAIKKIGYKKSLMGIRPESIEGMIVSDADMCDAIGVTGILRSYDYQKSNGKPFFDRGSFPDEKVEVSTYKLCDDSVVRHCFNKLLCLKNLMMTDAGKMEAANRHDIIVSILYHLFEEENASEWKEYLDKFIDNLPK